MVGQIVSRVVYVGLNYDDEPDVRWDYGDWHWPEVGVELTTRDGSEFFAIWDSKVTQFELTFDRGPISREWLPLQDVPPKARTWDVSDHPRWSDIVGTPITGYSLAMSEPDERHGAAPIALRLATGRGIVWLVAAAPRDEESATEDLGAEAVYLGHDELIVLFEDDRARKIGLTATS